MPRRPDRRRTDINYSRGRAGRPYERAKAECFARETHCAAERCLCPTGRLVDKSLPYPHRWSKSFGHVEFLDIPGTNPYVGRLEHLRCNTSAGAHYGNAKRRTTPTRREPQHLRSSPDLDT